MLDQGLVQVYTGDGKGKTTAALGLALRAAGRGLRVAIVQFLKPPCLDLGERLALARTDLSITVHGLDVEWDMAGSPKDPQARAQTRAAILAEIRRWAGAVEHREVDVLILDEIVYCLSQGLADLADIRDLLARRHPAVEVVLTGRGASDALLALTDLVTEMKDVKHPFGQGVRARPGIEY